MGPLAHRTPDLCVCSVGVKKSSNNQTYSSHLGSSRGGGWRPGPWAAHHVCQRCPLIFRSAPTGPLITYLRQIDSRFGHGGQVMTTCHSLGGERTEHPRSDEHILIYEVPRFHVFIKPKNRARIGEQETGDRASVHNLAHPCDISTWDHAELRSVYILSVVGSFFSNIRKGLVLSL